MADSRVAGSLWTQEEDVILLQHVARHGTKHWGSLQTSGLLPHRDQKACCNRFILLKRKFFQARARGQSAQSIFPFFGRINIAAAMSHSVTAASVDRSSSLHHVQTSSKPIMKRQTVLSPASHTAIVNQMSSPRHIVPVQLPPLVNQVAQPSAITSAILQASLVQANAQADALRSVAVKVAESLVSMAAAAKQSHVNAATAVAHAACASTPGSAAAMFNGGTVMSNLSDIPALVNASEFNAATGSTLGIPLPSNRSQGVPSQDNPSNAGMSGTNTGGSVSASAAGWLAGHGSKLEVVNSAAAYMDAWSSGDSSNFVKAPHSPVASSDTISMDGIKINVVPSLDAVADSDFLRGLTSLVSAQQDLPACVRSPAPASMNNLACIQPSSVHTPSGHAASLADLLGLRPDELLEQLSETPGQLLFGQSTLDSPVTTPVLPCLSPAVAASAWCTNNHHCGGLEDIVGQLNQCGALHAAHPQHQYQQATLAGDGDFAIDALLRHLGY